MFDAAESVGVDALGAVADAIADIREEFESVEGQELLGDVFDFLGRIAGVVADVFGALFEKLLSCPRKSPRFSRMSAPRFRS